jgi:ribonuclease HII
MGTPPSPTGGYGSPVATRRPDPTLEVEERCWAAGDRIVCGLDEVGRGAWAGPATIAAVVPGRTAIPGVRDSKQMSPAARERGAAAVRAWAVAIGIGHASPRECDELGMTKALRLAGMRALAEVEAQGFAPDRILLDGTHDFLGLGARVTTIVKGDATCLSIAAASVVAKVTRDALMAEAAADFPAYGFEGNKGYPAPVHQMALNGYGPTTFHRTSWSYVDDLPFHTLEPPPGRLL